MPISVEMLEEMFHDFLRTHMGLTQYQLRSLRLEGSMTPRACGLLVAILDSLEQQTKWIAEQRESEERELLYIARVGKQLRAAGLRSYTDEKGRIFVAGECP